VSERLTGQPWVKLANDKGKSNEWVSGLAVMTGTRKPERHLGMVAIGISMSGHSARSISRKEISRGARPVRSSRRTRRPLDLEHGFVLHRQD